MKKKLVIVLVVVLILAGVVYAAATVDEGHAVVRGWYTSEAFASHNAAMAIMRNPVVTGITAVEPDEDEADRTGRSRPRYSGTYR